MGRSRGYSLIFLYRRKLENLVTTFVDSGILNIKDYRLHSLGTYMSAPLFNNDSQVIYDAVSNADFI
jgi:hypothetical protein